MTPRDQESCAWAPEPLRTALAFLDFGGPELFWFVWRGAIYVASLYASLHLDALPDLRDSLRPRAGGLIDRGFKHIPCSGAMDRALRRRPTIASRRWRDLVPQRTRDGFKVRELGDAVLSEFRGGALSELLPDAILTPRGRRDPVVWSRGGVALALLAPMDAGDVEALDG